MKQIFTVKINGQKFYNIKFLSLSQSLDSLVHTLSLEVYDDQNIFSIGKACQLFVSTDFVPEVLLFTGYVTTYKKSLTYNNHTCEITCESNTIDIVECTSLLKRSFVNKPFKSLVSEICLPFGITVSFEITKNPIIKKFKFQTGETAFTAIERLCRFYGVLPRQLPNGNLLIMNSNKVNIAKRNLMVGNDLKSLEFTQTSNEVFSEYIGVSQYSGEGKIWNAQTISTQAKALDVSVQRYRPQLFVAEGRLERKNLKERVQWEAQVRQGRSTQYVGVLQGALNNASVWTLGDIVTIMDERKFTLLSMVSAIEIVQTLNEGTNIRLTFVSPNTYSQDPSENIKLV